MTFRAIPGEPWGYRSAVLRAAGFCNPLLESSTAHCDTFVYENGLKHQPVLFRDHTGQEGSLFGFWRNDIMMEIYMRTVTLCCFEVDAMTQRK